VEIYVQEHNIRLPHAAFREQTPDEIIFCKGGDVPGELEAGRLESRRTRLKTIAG
jgi:hypothetical protein